MKKLISLIAVAALAAAPVACDLQKTSDQLQANKVMVATVLSTPPLSIDPVALAGVDANYAFDNDSGFTFDGGVPDGGFAFFGDGGTLNIPGQTVAFVFFGERPNQSLDTPPNGLSGAVVTVGPKGGTATALKEDGSGNYSRTSLDDKGFVYQSGADYEFSATYQNDSYAGLVEKVPNLEHINEFHPSKGYVDQAAGTALTFTRPEPPANETRNFGFVTVYPIKNDGQKGDPTYTNVPKDPIGFLKLIAAPSEWRGSPVTIPGAAFPNPKTTYVVVFQSVKKGGPESNNLFTGSALLAGTADIAVVKTQ